MVTYLSKSNASEGFNQIIDFLNGSSIKYELTVNPNIYVPCIKQFLTTIAIKQMNDITRLQALVDKKKVVVMEATIQEALHLDDDEGVDCLPNKEIFAELARIGYEKSSTKLTFYKAFFSSHLVRNVDSTTKFYMYPRFLQLIIIKQVGDLSTHTTKYTSPALTHKVFANIRRVGKGFSRVERPLFEGMLVEQQVNEEGDTDKNVEEVNAGDAAEGDVSAAHEEVLTVTEEPSIPSLTPPQPAQDIPLTSQLKRRVKKLKRRNTVRKLKFRRLQRVGTSHRVETSDETVLDDVSNQGRMIAKMDLDDAVVLEDDKEDDREVADAVKDVEEAKDEAEPAEVQEVVDVVTTAKLITKVVTVASAIITTTEAQVPAATLTAALARVSAAPSRKRKGVVIKDLQEESTTSTIIPAETKSKDKGKGILMDYFKGMSYDEIPPIFEAKFNSNVAFLLKTKEQIEEDENRALQKLNETPAEREAKRRKLDEEIKELKRHLQIVPNEDDDVYTEATPLARKVPVVDYQIIEMNNKP
nr:hypothetical protein [Tanacetum cinerariifolium]